MRRCSSIASSTGMVGEPSGLVEWSKFPANTAMLILSASSANLSASRKSDIPSLTTSVLPVFRRCAQSRRIGIGRSNAASDLRGHPLWPGERTTVGWSGRNPPFLQCGLHRGARLGECPAVALQILRHVHGQTPGCIELLDDGRPLLLGAQRMLLDVLTYTHGTSVLTRPPPPSSSLKIMRELFPTRNSIQGCPCSPSGSGSRSSGRGSGDSKPKTLASQRAAAAGLA